MSKANHNQDILQFHFKFFITASRDQPRPVLSRNPVSRNSHQIESKLFPLVGPKSGNEARSINVFLLTIVNEHQLYLPIVKLRTISSWFRRHFVGTMFWYRVTVRSYSFGKWWESLVTIFKQWRAWSITWPNNLVFLKFSLLYHISFLVDVFNHSF